MPVRQFYLCLRLTLAIARPQKNYFVTMANNIAVPRFGRTGTGVDEWGAETFDVDLLTEFLLEESNPSSGGISFDFK